MTELLLIGAGIFLGAALMEVVRQWRPRRKRRPGEPKRGPK